MISILIPIYNQDVRKLVDKLFNQCVKLDIEFEILCYDDLSRDKIKEKNKEIGGKVGVSYMELSKNLGRSKIRNWLGKNARYELLLFMDCDSVVEKTTYVKQYIEASEKADLVYGGTSYQKRKPNINYALHWKYGRKIEAMPVVERQKHPFSSFRSNNFLIKRAVFMDNQFDESIVGYGYEDNAIGEQLKKAGHSIIHIDNPLRHTGLEKTEVFLKKTATAMENLAKLYTDGSISTRLTKMYEKMKDLGGVAVFRLVDRFLGNYLDKKLYIENPSLLAFQWYKLRLFLAELKKLEKKVDSE